MRVLSKNAQIFSDDVSQSCGNVGTAVQFGNFMTIIGIVMAVIGGISMILGSVIRDKRGLTRQDTDYY